MTRRSPLLAFAGFLLLGAHGCSDPPIEPVLLSPLLSATAALSPLGHLGIVGADEDDMVLLANGPSGGLVAIELSTSRVVAVTAAARGAVIGVCPVAWAQADAAIVVASGEPEPAVEIWTYARATGFSRRVTIAGRSIWEVDGRSACVASGDAVFVVAARLAAGTAHDGLGFNLWLTQEWLSASESAGPCDELGCLPAFRLGGGLLDARFGTAIARRADGRLLLSTPGPSFVTSAWNLHTRECDPATLTCEIEEFSETSVPRSDYSAISSRDLRLWLEQPGTTVVVADSSTVQVGTWPFVEGQSGELVDVADVDGESHVRLLAGRPGETAEAQEVAVRTSEGDTPQLRLLRRFSLEGSRAHTVRAARSLGATFAVASGTSSGTSGLLVYALPESR